MEKIAPLRGYENVLLYQPLKSRTLSGVQFFPSTVGGKFPAPPWVPENHFVIAPFKKSFGHPKWRRIFPISRSSVLGYVKMFDTGMFDTGITFVSCF